MVSVIAQENLKLAVFLFHCQGRCTIDWEVTGLCEEMVHLLAGQKRLEDEYKDPDVLPKVNKAGMVGTMESIKEYLRSWCGVVILPLACEIRNTITVQTYCDYPK